MVAQKYGIYFVENNILKRKSFTVAPYNFLKLLNAHFKPGY